MAKLVFNIRSASLTDIRAMDRHEVQRTRNGTSAIDPARTHLNETLHGSDAGPLAALHDLYDQGVRKPAKQAETPFVQVVIGASPEYFRPDDPTARGSWDTARMQAWRDRSLAWLRAEFGDDLAHVSVHLDEDTPHMHALIVPTYERKARVPGRRKRGETDDQFEERRRIAREGPGVRTVGRASHETLSARDSYVRLRESLSAAVEDLGIQYGEDRRPDAPPGLSTREWVAQETARLRREGQAQAEAAASADERLAIQERALALRERVLDGAEAQLDEREAELDQRETRLRAVYRRVQQLLGEVADHLGVGRSLAAISGAIRDHVTEPEEDDSPSFDPS